MSRFNNQDKPKANWTEVHSVTVGDQKRSFYLSDGGAVKITRHTDKGEQQVIMMPAAALEDLIAVSNELPQVFQAFRDIADDIAKVKALRKEEAKLSAQKQRELEREILRVQAAKDQERLALARIEALTGKKVS